MIGSVGAILGKEGVNISSMTVAPMTVDDDGNKGEALMILELDKPVGKEVLNSIKAIHGILNTDLVEL